MEFIDWTVGTKTSSGECNTDLLRITDQNSGASAETYCGAIAPDPQGKHKGRPITKSLVCLFVYIYLASFIDIYIFVCLFIGLYVCLFIGLYVCLFIVYISIYLSVCLSIYLSIYQSSLSLYLCLC